MSRLELEEVAAKITSVNPRAELHGDDHVPAVDIGISFDSENSILSMFGAQLRASLFSKTRPKDAPPGDQSGLDLGASGMPHLRNPCIDGGVRILFEGVGYAATIGYGISERSAIRLHDVRVGKIKATPHEGGMVVITLRLQVSDPDESTIGRLARMVGDKIDFTLAPPKSDQADID